MVNEAIETARGITDLGMLAVAAGFFLVLSGTMMLGLFRWFRKIIDNTLRENTACATDLRTRLDDLADGVGAISEGLRPETRLRIRETVAIHFRYAVERVCRLIKRVREENNIRNHEATARKIRTLLKNIHDERNRAFDSYTYKGHKLSEYTDEGWIERVAQVVEGEIYNEAGAKTAAPTRTCGWPTTRSKTTSCNGWTNESVGIFAFGGAPCGSVPGGRWTKPCTAPESVRRDTVILRDTLAVPVPTPDRVEVIRRDTCWLVRCDTVLTADTLRVPVVVPIERRVYVTADYRAEVEGYRPRLVSMELYRQTQVVTETPAARPRRWGIGIQAGYGLAPRTGHFEPYIGVGIQYSIWQW